MLARSRTSLPEGDGFGVLRASKELDPHLPVIVMTAYGSIQDAVAAMKEGALDFLGRPKQSGCETACERGLTQAFRSAQQDRLRDPVPLDHLRQRKLALEFYQRALALVDKRAASFPPAQARMRVQELNR